MRRLGFGPKWALSHCVLVTSVLTLGIVAVGYWLAQGVESRATRELQEKTRLSRGLMEGTDADLRTHAPHPAGRWHDL